jgi:hypothetical protein
MISHCLRATALGKAWQSHCYEEDPSHVLEWVRAPLLLISRTFGSICEGVVYGYVVTVRYI